jgi:hypothetical protein
MRERRLNSEAYASPASQSVSDRRVFFLGKVQVVRRPPKDGRPAQPVTDIPVAAEQPDFHQAS